MGCCLSLWDVRKDNISTLRSINLVIVGDGFCGKTNLLLQYSENKFNPRWMPHKLETRTVYKVIKGKKVALNVWDPGVRLDCLDAEFYLDKNVILLCFSIDGPQSLDSVILNWSLELKSLCSRVPVILVGTKIDLRNEEKAKSPKGTAAKTATVSQINGQTVAKKIGAYAYRECSSKSGVGVADVFKTAVEAVFHKEK